MNRKKISIFCMLTFSLLFLLIPPALSAETGGETFISGIGETHSVAKTGVSGVTEGKLIYSSALSARVLSENPCVPLETIYTVDIASADPEHPVSAIVSTLFAAKSVTMLPNNSNISASTTDIEDRTRIAGQINRIMKEFSYTFPLISMQ